MSLFCNRPLRISHRCDCCHLVVMTARQLTSRSSPWNDRMVRTVPQKLDSRHWIRFWRLTRWNSRCTQSTRACSLTLAPSGSCLWWSSGESGRYLAHITGRQVCMANRSIALKCLGFVFSFYITFLWVQHACWRFTANLCLVTLLSSELFSPATLSNGNQIIQFKTNWHTRNHYY